MGAGIEGRIIRTIMPTLESLIDTTTLIFAKVLDENQPTVVKILGVEASGIWVESQKATEHWLKQFKRESSPKTLVWFLPFSQISWILGSEDYPAFSEKYLGQTPE